MPFRLIQRDSAGDAVRVRVRITSRASAVTVTTDGAVITNAAVERVDGGISERPVVEGGRVGYAGNFPGLEVDACFRVTLARLRGSRVTFRVDRGGPGAAALEIANINDESNPRIVDGSRLTTARQPSPAARSSCGRVARSRSPPSCRASCSRSTIPGTSARPGTARC